MPEPAIAAPPPDTMAELVERLGFIPLDRIRLRPAPGTATEADVLARPDGVKRLCELVDSVLVEKPTGYYESRLAVVVARRLDEYAEAHDLGIVLGPDATLRLRPGLVRLPDVSFVSWRRFPDRRLPAESVPDLAPDLAVEILSEGNTAQEMSRKLREYFRAGTGLVWYIDPQTRTVRVHTSAHEYRLLNEADTLDGGSILPGFSLPLREIFWRAGERHTP